MKTSEELAKVGMSAFVIWFGGGFLIFFVSWLTEASVSPTFWKLFALVFGAGGLGCFVAAVVCGIWED
jgi:hypothetical protein